MHQLAFVRATVLAFVAMAGAGLRAQSPESPAAPPCGPLAKARGGWSDVSPTVFGSYEAYELPNGHKELCFLILWRGQAGWHEYRAAALAAAEQQNMIDTVAAASRAQRHLHWPSAMASWEYLGDIEIEVQYNPTSRRLWIYGKEIDLSKDNVVLLDHVDRIGGTPGIAGTMRVDPAIESLDVSFADLIERSQTLAAFVR